jgi:hypothetical protein
VVDDPGPAQIQQAERRLHDYMILRAGSPTAAEADTAAAV